MRRAARLISALLLAVAARAECPQAAAVKELTDPAAVQTAALQLLDCLGEADPERRDGLGFEQLSTWMRADRLDRSTLQRMRVRLLTVLMKPADPLGVHQPFAVLVLSEIARVDRIKPFLDIAQRAELVDRASLWLRSWRDYRGFDEREGWRHGVAHGADLALQLALNPALVATQRRELLDALGSQALADSQHAYRFGEGARLARAAQFALAGAELDAEAWTAWLMRLVQPLAEAKSLDTRSLTQLHNLREFLWPLYVGLNEQPDAGLRERLLPALAKTLKRLP